MRGDTGADRARLAALLRRDGSNLLATRCSTALSDPLAGYSAFDRLMETGHALDIYGLRAEVHENDPHVQGMDSLARALAATTHAFVRLHDVQDSHERFSVFTDPEVSELLGVVAVRPRRGRRRL